MVALLALGACAAFVPVGGRLLLTAGLSGLGALLCLPPLLFSSAAATLTLPACPPGLQLHLALVPLSAFFLLLVLLSGTASAAFQATTAARDGSTGATALCLAGLILSLLAADGITLVLGSALVCGVIFPDWTTARGGAALTNRVGLSMLLIPLLLLGAVCLLTPPGFAPRFDA